MSSQNTSSDSLQNELPLTSEDRQRLFGLSGLSEETVRQRGYQSVTAESHAANYRENGWGNLAANLPALEIPLWTVDGKASVPQIRPNNPKVNSKGKVLKYVYPQGELMHIDVHPSLSDRIKGTEPLIITEGVIKADSAVSRGLCCIALLGVWNFRGTNVHGGVTVLADWQEINLKNRQVYIAFDSDVTIKPEVQKALTVLRTFLTSKGAVCHTVRLAPGESGEKVGLDDFFVSGKSVDDFWAIAEGPVDEALLPVSVQQETTYVVHNGELCTSRRTIEGQIVTPLCNFNASIDEVIVKSDGVEETREFRVSGTLANGTPLCQVDVPVKEFLSMGWALEKWAGKAVIHSGKGTREHVATAMQKLSLGAIGETTMYTHSGWTKIDGSWHYLTTAGALGEAGLHDDVHVTLEDALLAVNLPAPDEKQLIAGVEASCDLLNLGPISTMATALGATYLAPLSIALKPNFMTHIEGRTGSFKSEVAALMQGHFGKGLNSQALPGSWTSSANYMEKQAFDAKDCLIVMDDFKPTGGKGDQQKYQQKAEQFIRNLGNSAGRGRMTADIKSRRQFRSRGVVLSTGEDSPQVESIRARMAIAYLERGNIDPRNLSKAQAKRDAGVYADAMAGYVQWLAPQLDDLKTTLATWHQSFLDEVNARVANVEAPRTPAITATLILAWKLWTQYAVECAALTAAEANVLFSKAKEALIEGAISTNEHVQTENVSDRSIEILRTAFESQQAHLDCVDSPGFVEGLQSYGWRIVDGGERRAMGNLIGWVSFETKQVYLADTALTFIKQEAERLGAPISDSPTRWAKNLEARGYISRDAGARSGSLKQRVYLKERGRVHVLAVSAQADLFVEREAISAEEPTNF